MKGLYKLILLFVFGIYSCEDTIDIDFPEAGNNLVLNVLVQNGDSITAKISQSLPYQELALPPSLNNGLLSLYKDGVWISNANICRKEVLIDNYLDTTYTYCFNHLAEERSRYKIVASTDEFSAIEGETFLGRAGKIENVQFNGLQNFSFVIDDNPDEENYYFFSLTYRDTVNNSNGYLLNLDAPDLSIEMIGTSDEVISFPSSANLGTNGFLDDKTFNGKKKKILIYASFASGFGHRDLKITSCSMEYYQFFRTSLRAQFLFNNLFSYPTDVFSNVSNGYGMVGSSWDTVVRFTD